MKTLLLVFLMPMAVLAETPDGIDISEAQIDADGFQTHAVQSPYQAGKTLLRVLLPAELDQGKRYPVVYVLPVEANTESRFGDGLREIQKLQLHNRFDTIFVAPTFSHLPWYADHPSDPGIRQETYLLQVILPAVEARYLARSDADGRYLLGFSKSGWGAFSLLLRHPDIFGKAAAWDAPLMKHKPDQFGMGPIFGTQQNFAHYEVSKLLQQRADLFQNGRRLILTGYGNFRQHHQLFHDLMLELGVSHEYRDGPQQKHDWHSGWVEEAVEYLLAARSNTQ